MAIALAVALVGASSLLNPAKGGVGGDSQAALGVFLTVAGTFMQSIQYVYEEKVIRLISVLTARSPRAHSHH